MRPSFKIYFYLYQTLPLRTSLVTLLLLFNEDDFTISAKLACFWVFLQTWLTPLLTIEKHFEQTGRHLAGGEMATILGVPTGFDTSLTWLL